MLWATFCLYIALGATFVYIGPDRIGQAMYNFAQKISHYQYGWLILTAVFCAYPSAGAPPLNPKNTPSHALASRHILPSGRRSHHTYHPLWICIWNEGLPYCRVRLPLRIGRDVRRAPLLVQEQAAQVLGVE